MQNYISSWLQRDLLMYSISHYISFLFQENTNNGKPKRSRETYEDNKTREQNSNVDLRG